MPKVSVIIPCYHAETWIGRCLQSVMDQTFTDWEVVLIIDDWKADRTKEVAAKWIPSDKVRYLLNEHKSNPATARNRGVKAAAGEYIAFLDADDYWDSRKLEKQVAILETNPVIGIVYSKQQKFGKINKAWGMHYNPRNLQLPFSSIIVRKAQCLPFDENIPAADDYDWVMSSNDAGIGMHFIDEVLSFQDVHGGNLTCDSPLKSNFQNLPIDIKRKDWVRVGFRIAQIPLLWYRSKKLEISARKEGY